MMLARSNVALAAPSGWRYGVDHFALQCIARREA
jgi:hypothetical protein